MRTGIMGGTFDPIHLGHVIAAESAREALGLEEVWFMPSNKPTYKSSAPAASPEARLAMARLAIQENRAFRIQDIEIERGGITYTIDTITLLNQLYPDRTFYYIIGADMIEFLPHWHRYEELLAILQFIGIERPGTPLDFTQLPAAVSQRVTMVSSPLFDISSTDIRNRIKNGRTVKYLLHDRVIEYIRENQLYV